MKRRKELPLRKRHSRSWLGKKPRIGFRGYPIATVAFYGPTDRLATKVAVSIILTESGRPDSLQRWCSDGGRDERHDPAIGEQVLAFLKTHAPRSTVVADRILGCPQRRGHGLPGRNVLS